jgi:GTPase Era involved in 16S rRNA processing
LLHRSYLPSGIVLRAFFGARVRDELPHASCVETGDRTFRENNAVQVAGLDRICLEDGSQSQVLDLGD